jgi:hypothetical protein
MSFAYRLILLTDTCSLLLLLATCSVVTATSRRSCPVAVAQQVGYLSSLTAVESSIGVQSCPWIIHLEAGRRVNVSLYNLFDRSTSGLSASRGRPRPASSVRDCADWTVIIREGNQTTDVPVCHGADAGIGGRSVMGDTDDEWSRENVIYTSHGGTMLMIYLSAAIVTDTSFDSTQLRSSPLLLRYDGWHPSRVYSCNSI